MVLLGALAALPPLAIDMCLPALADIQEDFGTNAAGAGLTLSLFLAGFAVAQIVIGPLSDALGRRPVLLAGLGLFVLGGLGAALSRSIVQLVLWRLLEGSGAAAGTVMAFAIVRDLFEGVEARRKLSYVATVLPLAPMVAPTLGSLLMLVAGWRAIYGLLAGAGLVLLVVVDLWTKETRPDGRVTAPVRRAYWTVLRHRRVGGFAAANALSFAMLFAWVSGSPHVLMLDGGVQEVGYALLFACTSGGLLVGAWINGRLAARRVPLLWPLAAGLGGALLASLAALALTATGPLRLSVLVPLVVAVMACRGLAGPNMAHAALEPLPETAGVVSAVLGCSQMAAGAAVSAAVAALYPHLGPLAVTLAMVVCATGALAVGRWAHDG